MRIGVISDTHGHIEAWKKAENVWNGVDIIVHAGDVLYHPPRLQGLPGYDLLAMVEALNSSVTPIVIAKGNVDPEVYEELLKMPVQSPYALVQAGDVRIVANHGHMLTREQMIETAKRYKADVFVSGHTHIPVLEKVDDTVLLNPGSAAIPKFDVDGKPTGTVALIEDRSIRVLSVEDGRVVFELGI
jgi:putative phosphoesterase